MQTKNDEPCLGCGECNPDKFATRDAVYCKACVEAMLEEEANARSDVARNLRSYDN